MTLPEMSTLVDILAPLSPDEQAGRFELEEMVVISEALALKAARAVRELRDRRLYRSTHATFEEYGQDALNLSRARLYQLIHWADVHELGDLQGFEISGERVARALGVVPPEDYRLVLAVTRAVTGKDKPSSADVQGVADTVRDMAAGMVEHPDTREPTPFASLPPERKAEAVTQAVQASSKDRRDFLGTDDIKPLDWIANFQQMGVPGRIEFDAQGYRLCLVNDEGVLNVGPVRKSIWDAIRAARAVWEA